MKVHNGLLLLMVTFTTLLCYKFISIKPTGAPQAEKVITVADREKGKKEEILHHVIDYIRYENKTLKGEEMRNISKLVYDESRRYKLDYRLVLSLMKVESNFRHNAISKKGARGLLQVKPSLARYVAEDAGVFWQGDETLDEPEENTLCVNISETLSTQ